MAGQSFYQRNRHLLVVAIDFGTCYSGYAFSFKSDPYTVHTNTWNSGCSGLVSLKAPTCILLNPDGQFHAFGYDAENKYNELVKMDDHERWRLFRRFKMTLHHNKSLSRFSTVNDIRERPMQALPLFVMSIRYMREHFLAALTKQGADIREDDIQYVLTVPAIWDDKAKQFMREAAQQAGINNKRLRLALEPEAASIWCEKVHPEVADVISKTGASYMVVDLGGGTADISIFKKTKRGTLKQIYRNSGGPWGGMYVDVAFHKMLDDIFGVKAIENLKSEDIEDYLHLWRDFEVKKREFHFNSEEDFVIRLPSILQTNSERFTGEDLVDRLKKYGSYITVTSSGDKLTIKNKLAMSWFEEPLSNLFNHLRSVFANEALSSVQTVLLVGGFGESAYVQERFREELGNKTLIVPSQASLVVLKGAVRYGHEAHLISSRVVKESYGIRVRQKCEPLTHIGIKKTLVNGQLFVENVFLSFVDEGERVETDVETVFKGLTPTDMLSTGITILKAPDNSVNYTCDPRCKEIGKIKIYHPEGQTLEDKKMDIAFIFGGTEIEVRARMQRINKEATVKIDFLD